MNLEFNKITASILLAGLVAMLAGTASKVLYASENGHDHEEKRGYKIEGVEVAAAGKKAEINIPALLASGTAEAGAKVAKKCVACHSFDKGGKNKVGPNLYNIVGASKGGNAGFKYSKALTAKGGNWGYEELWAFLNGPAKYIKGTKMSFAGLKKPEQLANIIAYLRSFSDNPPALPKVEATAAIEASTTETTEEATAKVVEASTKAQEVVKDVIKAAEDAKNSTESKAQEKIVELTK